MIVVFRQPIDFLFFIIQFVKDMLNPTAQTKIETLKEIVKVYQSFQAPLTCLSAANFL